MQRASPSRPTPSEPSSTHARAGRSRAQREPEQADAERGGRTGSIAGSIAKAEPRSRAPDPAPGRGKALPVGRADNRGADPRGPDLTATDRRTAEATTRRQHRGRGPAATWQPLPELSAVPCSATTPPSWPNTEGGIGETWACLSPQAQVSTLRYTLVERARSTAGVLRNDTVRTRPAPPKTCAHRFCWGSALHHNADASSCQSSHPKASVR